MRSDIHWHEGLHLRPHHLQWLSREILEGRELDRRFAMPYPYGVIELKVAEDALAKRTVRITSLRAVMPSGRYVELGTNASIPDLVVDDSLEMRGGRLEVRLGIPIWRPHDRNVVSADAPVESNEREVYVLGEEDWSDENTGGARARITVRRLNGRLIREGDDATRLEVLPLLRLMTDATGAGPSLRLDSTFAPPCLTLSGSPELRDAVFGLLEVLSKCRDDLAARVTSRGPGFGHVGGEQLREMLRLQALSVAVNRLAAIRDRAVVTPWEAWSILSETLASLSAIQPEQGIDPWVRYDHDQPLPGILDLRDRIRPLATAGREDSYLSLDFVRGQPGRPHMVELAPEHFERANQFFVVVKSRLGAEEVRKKVLDQHGFKVVPESELRARNFPLELRHEHNVPFTTDRDEYAFSIDRTVRPQLWEMVRKEAKLGIRWKDMATDDFTFKLYMTLVD